MKVGLLSQLLEDITGEPFYTDSEAHNNQFVGRASMQKTALEEVLCDLGFEENPFAAWRNHGSWRKIGYDDFPRMQLHAILYDSNNIQNAETDVTYVYAHWELRWDVSAWGHYRGHVYNPDEGVRRTKKLLNEAGVFYEPIRP